MRPMVTPKPLTFRLLVAVAIAATTLACGPPCSTAKRIGYGIVTFGIYAHACANRDHTANAVADVQSCIAQGGDPAYCREVVYRAYGNPMR